MDKQYKNILKQHLAAENAHDINGTLKTLTKDCVFEDKALNKTFHGHHGAKLYYQQWWRGFNMLVQTENRYYPLPELVVVETRFKGRHLDDFFAIKATHRQIDLPIVIFIVLKNGLLAGERFYWDRLTLAEQLGQSTLKIENSEEASF